MPRLEIEDGSIIVLEKSRKKWQIIIQDEKGSKAFISNRHVFRTIADFINASEAVRSEIPEREE